MVKPKALFQIAIPLLGYLANALPSNNDVIHLGNKRYNGTTQVEFTTKALGEADFFKLNPAPNDTTFDSWYFDAMNPSTNETVIFNFEIQWPVDTSVPATEMFYRVTIFGSFANGTAYSYEVEADYAKITQEADKGMRVDLFGGNEISWSGSSLLKPKPTYKVTINAPDLGIIGSLVLHGNDVAPHFACGTDAAGVDERIQTGVGWANAIPDANATVSLKINDTKIAFEGYGYHDKTWVDRPFQNALQSAFWGHARVGPYAAVWWHSHAQDGSDISSEYLATWEDGHVIASRCVYSPNNTLGWGEGQTWPLLPGTPAPAGMILHWDLGDAGVFVANITSQDIFVDIPYWQAGRGSVTGGFEGEKVYTDETGVWTLNQLEPIGDS